MNLDDLLLGYFGTASLADLAPNPRAAGVERMLVDLGLSRDGGHRFALWSLLHMLDAAPDLDVAFADPTGTQPAIFMDLLAAAEGAGER